ncbi:MAG TPA: hypothetical protein PK016_05410 [Candidatus Atribacteria bacterium]|nr:hypothetical protein [Candidatus Atribacteria bacterium]
MENWKRAVEIKGTPKKANLDHTSAVSSSGDTYIKELGNSHRKIEKVIKKKRMLSREAFSRIKILIPVERIVRLVKRTARAKIVKL